MKRLLAAACLLALPVTAGADVLLPGYIETGAYGSAVVRVSQLGKSETGTFLGGGGGFLFDRQFMVGAELMVLVDDLPYRTKAGEDRYIEYTTGDLRVGYVFWPDAIVHPALSGQAGLGWIKLRNPDKGPNESDPDADTVFQLQPALHLILNLTRTARISISGGYRWVSGIDTEDFVDQDAEGAYGDFAVSFGAF